MMKLLKEITHKNEILTVWHSDNCISVPPIKLMTSCYLELLENNFNTPGIPFRNNTSVIWLENSDKTVVTGQVYDYITDRQECWINLSFTDEKYRGQGLNQICHKCLIEIIKNLGGVTIGSVISINNEKMLSAARKRGANLEFYRSIQRI